MSRTARLAPPGGSRRRRGLPSWRGSAAVVASGALLAACGSGTAATDSGAQTDASASADAPASSAAPAEGAPVVGGTAVVALDNSVVCVDPQQATAFAGLLAVQHTVDQLTFQNPETAELEPWLATEWAVNEDATEFAFTLRDDVTFSDGTALTADVVRRNAEEIQALGAKASLGSTYLAGLTGVVADGDVVTFTFAEPNAQFLQATSMASLGILSETSYDLTPEERCLGTFHGSGPFTVAEVVPDESVSLERREGYAWAPASVANQGDAYLDGIEFRIVLEAGVRSGLLESGQIDATLGVFSEDEQRFTDNDATWLVARAVPGFSNSFVVNSRSPILADDDVRTALQIGIDRAQVLEVTGSSLAVAPVGLLSSTAPFGGDFTDLFPYEPERAIELLDAAGWVPGADGVREKDGQRLSLTIVHFAAQSPTVELVNQQLHAVGVELVSEVLDPAKRDEVEQAGAFDLIQRNLSRPDPDVLRNQFSVDYSNYLYRDAADGLDELLAQQAATTDVAARQAIIDEIQTQLLGEACVLPINEITQVYGGSVALQGTTLDAASRLNLYSAWKDAA